MNNLNSVLLRPFTTLVFLFCMGNVFAQAQNVAEKKGEQSPPSKVEESTQWNAPKTQPLVEKFQVTTKDEPQGNSLEAQIARAEFYKAQYAHDPATQAKYQQNIDMLKLAQMKATSNNPK